MNNLAKNAFSAVSEYLEEKGYNCIETVDFEGCAERPTFKLTTCTDGFVVEYGDNGHGVARGYTKK